MGLTGSCAPPGPEVRRHRFHADSSVQWAVSNCYVDLWLEVLQWQRLEPVAGLSFNLAVDFEGDQWTFIKYPTWDLLYLYGLDVTELLIWGRLLDHVVEQVEAGRLIVCEVDAFYLADTAATSYRTRHQKTTIAITDVDPGARRLRYFHDLGFHALEGEDFEALFDVATDRSSPWRIPPYVELVKLDRVQRLPEPELTRRAGDLARVHLARRPERNPFATYRERFGEQLDRLREGGEESFHDYAFANIRQAGAACQYASEFLSWLDDRSDAALAAPADGLAALSADLKALLLRLARAIASGRDGQLDSHLEAAEQRWESAMAQTVTELGVDTAVLSGARA
jgi:hypothetical protein